MSNTQSVLALDLGTKTGWALLRDGVITSGTWVLATPKEVKQQKLSGKDRCCEMRIARLLNHIEAFGELDQLWFEDVQFSTTTYQAHLWASLRAVVILQGPRRVVKAVPVGTLKKFATGFGNADKPMMAKALGTVVDPVKLAAMDDNEVDAYHLLRMARKELGV